MLENLRRPKDLKMLEPQNVSCPQNQGCLGSRKKSGRISGRVFKIFLGSGFGFRVEKKSGFRVSGRVSGRVN